MHRGLIFLFTLVPALGFGQNNVLEGHKLATAPTIDGTVDPAEWGNVPTGRGGFDVETGQGAPEDTEFWLAYDEKFVYFAARAHDGQPQSISATEYRTNVSLAGDDNIMLQLDLGGSLADFNEFGMNPRGATQIGLAGGRAAKREWSGEFVSSARVTPTGWEVEARIPWRIMRLPAKGPRTVRFNVQRGLRRLSRNYVWQYTGGGHPDNYGRWTNVEIPAAPVEREFKLLPYTYAGVDEEGHIVNAGLDLKTNLAEQVVLVGSVNPDFRNIENAILSLDFSRFERLANETRPFFQEGSQYLGSALFASQRISGFDTGVNVHGRLNDRTSFGILNTVDFGNQNSLVSNFTYDPNPNDSYRVTATSLTRPGFYNEGYLLRYQHLIGPAYVFLRTMGTKDSDFGDGLYNTANVGYSKNGVSLNASYDTVSPSFVPRLGFTPERDYKGLTLDTGWQAPVKKGPVSNLSAAVFWQNLDRYEGGHYRNTLFMNTEVQFRNRFLLQLSTTQEDFLGTFDRLYSVLALYPQGNPYRRLSLQYDWGKIEHQDYKSISVSTGYRPIDKLQLTGSIQHVEHFESSDLGILGLNWDIGNDRYVSGRVVKRDHDWNAYLAFRRSGNRGAEYFLILGDPNSQTFKPSLILKMVWPIGF